MKADELASLVGGQPRDVQLSGQLYSDHSKRAAAVAQTQHRTCSSPSLVLSGLAHELADLVERQPRDIQLGGQLHSGHAGLAAAAEQPRAMPAVRPGHHQHARARVARDHRLHLVLQQDQAGWESAGVTIRCGPNTAGTRCGRARGTAVSTWSCSRTRHVRSANARYVARLNCQLPENS